MADEKRPEVEVDRRDAFEVKRRATTADPDLVITIREAPSSARWARRPPEVIHSCGRSRK